MEKAGRGERRKRKVEKHVRERKRIVEKGSGEGEK